MNCPKCLSEEIVKNGSIHTGMQKYKCKECGRQFIKNPRNKRIEESKNKIIESALLERISIAGIARILGLSKRWTQNYVNHFYKTISHKLNEIVC